MEFPQHIWDIILEYNGFMIETSMKLMHDEHSLWSTLGIIDHYGQIAVSPKHFLRVLKFFQAEAEFSICEPRIASQFIDRYELHTRFWEYQDLYHYLAYPCQPELVSESDTE